MHLIRFCLFIALTIGVQATVDAASKRKVKAKPLQTTLQTHAITYANDVRLPALADHLSNAYQLDAQAVLSVLKTAKRNLTTIRLMTPSVSAAGAMVGRKNWFAYKSRNVSPTHVKAGLAFWHEHEQTLARAEAQYGVPPYIILGILGVETIYGRNTGSFSVLDAITTLALDYPANHPRRQMRLDYFTGELGSLMQLSAQTGRDIHAIKGSFAGAMGLPQFMPSSWLKYAVDFDSDGKVDLWNSPADIIGSVANYFKGYGWKSGAPIVHALYQGAQERPTEARHRWVELESAGQDSIWIDAAENFFVIARYNDSHFYVASVLELGSMINEARQQTLKP